MEQAALISFLTITVLLIITPGADMALISRAAITHGQIGAFSAMLGINCASILWTILAAVGFVAIVTAAPLASSPLMLVGALYMARVGFKDMVTGFRLKKAFNAVAPASAEEESTRDLFKKGFIVNITNPKIGLYYATVLPNFLSAGVDKGKYIALMGLTHNILGFFWFMLFSALLIRGDRLLGTSNSKANITIVTGSALILFAVMALFYLTKSNWDLFT